MKMRYILEKTGVGADWLTTKLTDTITRREIEESWKKTADGWEIETWWGEKKNYLSTGLYEVIRRDDDRCDSLLNDLFNNGWKETVEFDY